jgi:NAD(P)-dependent dehydrogenase (short-subunit alcohol dehydrogenase family)
MDTGSRGYYKGVRMPGDPVRRRTVRMRHITQTPESMNLKDKVALVTGASSGIGLDFSKTLVERGAVVYGMARSEDKLSDLSNELGDAFHALVGDVREEGDVKAAFDRIESDQGRLDVVVNNAGLGRHGKIAELSLEDWDVQMETNLRGIFLCSRAAIPMMKRQNADSGFGGHIVNIASVAGLVGNPGIASYNASKFGVRGFSEALMKEVRDDGIKVTCIYPGSVDTNFSNVSGGSLSPNAMTPRDISSTLIHVLETDDNYLISEVMMRPLRPKG